MKDNASRHLDDAGAARNREQYLASLVGSWRALSAASPGARVIATDAFVAARFPSEPLLDNALLLGSPTVRLQIEQIYADAGSYAIWTWRERDDLAESLRSAGYRRSEATTAMIIDLSDAELRPDPRVVHRVDPGEIAILNGVGPNIVRGVPGLRASRTGAGESGLVLIAVGSDVNVSFVATRPDARRQGLATAVTCAALAEARAAGFITASLQATPMAVQVYAKIGFRPVGFWQEWVLARPVTIR